MRAPVYRHVESKSTIAGLALFEMALLLSAAYVLIPLCSAITCIGGILALYILLRLAGRSRPPLFWQHFCVWKTREWLAGNRLSASARSLTPQFPFAAHLSHLADSPRPFSRYKIKEEH